MSNARTSLLELKVASGRASAAEIAELAATPLFIGGGVGVDGGPAGGYLVVPRPCLTEEEWQQKFGGQRLRLLAPVPEELPVHQPPEKLTYTADGLLLCAPEDEPNPRPRLHRV